MNHDLINYNFWQKGYFAPNVESFIFRFYGHYLKKKKIKNLLDFGCGQGAAVNFFNQNNINSFGVDISLTDINIAKKKNSKNKKKFIHIQSFKDIEKIFEKKKLDVIVASQSLYYLSDQDFKKLILIFKKILNKNGMIFATMISTKTSLYKKSINYKYGLRKIYVDKKKNSFHFINFTKNSSDLKNKFNIFKTIDTGYYSVCLNEKNDINHHYTFIGKKK